MFSQLKLWGLAALGVLLAILAGAAKLFKGQRDRARQRAKVAEAGIKRKAETEEREAEIDSEWSDVERVANESIDDIPDFLRNRRVRKRTD